ncbi:uncharacterized protein LOC112453776 isoform X2 [Temnothorax curvispinosus]|uniref:Uncharacterized protein LOC112453776 isoform X2 n=1 Tax=Temnothorax curvispinosus TaxID=300111 RepID=A0A6J1PMA2_9HYME|nr:uncharacterized protein LOC112453776 isoform X2 [Temnothorax curvispinosus]
MSEETKKEPNRNMAMAEFAEEFTRLIIRYTRISVNDDLSKNAPLRLISEDLVYTMHHVLHALNIKGFYSEAEKIESIKREMYLLKTSNGANAADIPETSVVTHNKHEPDIEKTSQDAFTDDEASVFSDISKASKEEQENSVSTLQNGKKSNPVICISNISRSDTFVREESQQVNAEDQEDVFEDVANGVEMDDLSSDNFQTLVSELQQSTRDIMVKLRNLERLPQLIRSKKVTAKLHQPPVPSGHSSPHRTSTMNKTKVLPNICRSSSAFPKMPTSPKLLTTESGNIFARRKSTGGIGTKASIGKSNKSKLDYSITQNGSSNLTLLAHNKVSPGSSVEFQPKVTKNPKYAHVQSTIPKAISQKKKMHDDKTSK